MWTIAYTKAGVLSMRFFVFFSHKNAPYLKDEEVLVFF